MTTVAMDSVAESRLDRATLRRAFGAFPSGVTALAAIVDGEPLGLVASSFTSVSLDPPLVSVCIANTSRTWKKLREAGQIGVSVFAEDQASHCQDIFQRSDDAFSRTRWQLDHGGALVLRDGCASFRCVVDAEIPAGDHVIVLLRILELDADHARAPMVFHRSRFTRTVPEPGARPLRPQWLTWDESTSALPAADVWG